MQVAFWSNMPGQTGTTSNLVAMACTIALNYRLKTIITHNHFDNCSMETALLGKRYIQNIRTQFQDIGIDALSRLTKFNNLEEEHVSRYTTCLLRGRLDLLIGTQNLNETLYLSEYGDIFEYILSKISKHYDLVFIDTVSGKHPYTKKVLEQSDIVVVNLNQNLRLLESFFKEDYFDVKEKCFFVMGMYDATSKYCIKNIRRHYKFKNPISVIPYNRGFADAFIEGKIIDFFLKNLKPKKGDPYYSFIQEVNHSARSLLDYMGIDISARDDSRC